MLLVGVFVEQPVGQRQLWSTRTSRIISVVRIPSWRCIRSSEMRFLCEGQGWLILSAVICN